LEATLWRIDEEILASPGNYVQPGKILMAASA